MDQIGSNHLCSDLGTSAHQAPSQTSPLASVVHRERTAADTPRLTRHAKAQKTETHPFISGAENLGVAQPS